MVWVPSAVISINKWLFVRKWEFALAADRIESTETERAKWKVHWKTSHS